MIIDRDTKAKCKDPYFATMKVRIFHPESNRKTWRNLDLCKKHFKEVMLSQGKGFYFIYNKSPLIENPIIEIKEELTFYW